MEFGKLEDINKVDWRLPVDDSKNSRWESSSKNQGNQDSRIFFGAPAWGRKHWLGKIYPPRATAEQFLYHYSRNFNSIELNTSHYRIPSEETVKNWRSQVPAHFHFCPKMHKDISHSKLGMHDAVLLRVWINFMEKWENHLGPCFMQFHEKFSYEEKGSLFYFLEKWPSQFKLSIELRHGSWFKNNSILPALGDYLYKKGIGLVITDVAGRRDVLHSSLTSNWSIIRLIGNNLVESDFSRLQNWSKRLKDWAKLGVENNYLFLHQPDDVWTIEFALQAQKIFENDGWRDVPRFSIQQSSFL